MLSIYDHVQIYLWNTGIDMRKGFHGLEALVSQNGLDPFDGSLFVCKRQQLITKIMIDFLKQCCSQIFIAKRRAILWQDLLTPKVKSMVL